MQSKSRLSWHAGKCLCALQTKQDAARILCWFSMGSLGVELGCGALNSAAVRIEGKLSNGLSVKDSPGPASLRLCSGRNFPPFREVEAMAKNLPLLSSIGTRGKLF